MTDVSITPEDRERLAKSKFGEWFDEFFEKKFEEAFEKKTTAVRNKTKPAEEEAGPEPDPTPKRETHQPRRRSLLETCLSDTFGF